MDWNGLEWIGIYNRFGLWTMEWITAEEAERLANDGDPILEPVSLAIIIYDHVFHHLLHFHNHCYPCHRLGVSLQDPA